MLSEDSKLVKKEEEEVEDDDDDKPILHGLKKKLSNANGARGSAKSKPKLKKEESEAECDDDDDDNRPIGKRSSISKPDKEPKKKKRTKEVEKKSKEVEKTSEKEKVYDLPGQKRDPPEERDPMRNFYETLYKHSPIGEMAQFWMMESGLLSKEEAKKVYEKKQKKSLQQKLSSPAKVVATLSRVLSLLVLRENYHPPQLLRTKRRQQTQKLHRSGLRNRRLKMEALRMNLMMTLFWLTRRKSYPPKFLLIKRRRLSPKLYRSSLSKKRLLMKVLMMNRMIALNLMCPNK